MIAGKRVACLAAVLTSLSVVSRAQVKVAVLYDFARLDISGAAPVAGLARDAAGSLYGTTPQGGQSGEGVVFKIDTGGRQRVLHQFTGGADGGLPESSGVLDEAGNLYGTTAGGGAYGLGVVYKIDGQGAWSVLYSFTGGTGGGNPEAGLTLDSSGNLYGTAGNVVFKLDVAGQESVLYTFTGGANGLNPMGGVIRDAAGNLYGTTEDGGSAGYGVVYKLNTPGVLTILHTFIGTDGAHPHGRLLLDRSGDLYGTTQSGGPRQKGVVYKVGAGGQFSVLYAFNGDADGGFPYAGLSADAAGTLYGTTTRGGFLSNGVVFKLDAAANETTLYTFTGGTDGGDPEAGVVLDPAGNLYGTTKSGNPALDKGVVYRLNPVGQETVLYTFMGGPSGTRPDAGVILDAAGNLYGTTYFGGVGSNGTIYRLDTTGHETVLHSFAGPGDGANPSAAVVMDSGGNLYGTTVYGGSANGGVVFELDTSGVETLLHSFAGGADGANPKAGLILDAAGNIYGTTPYGGSADAGVVFKISSSGEESVLYTFSGGADGGNPSGGLTADSSGNLYGVASRGGVGDGVVYKLDPAGNEIVLYAFGSEMPELYSPSGSLALDSAGNLYGTVMENNVAGYGAVYKLSTSGSLNLLHSFMYNDGSLPLSGVTIDVAGNLYGATFEGGRADAGVVYTISAAGQFSVLFVFSGQGDGSNPQSGVTLDAAGNLIGTASYGGNLTGGNVEAGGVIYKLTYQK